MTLEKVKEILTEGGFSPEVQTQIRSILDVASARGSLTEEEKSKLITLIEFDIEAATIEEETMQKTSSVLDSFVEDADKALDTLLADIKTAK